MKNVQRMKSRSVSRNKGKKNRFSSDYFARNFGQSNEPSQTGGNYAQGTQVKKLSRGFSHFRPRTQKSINSQSKGTGKPQSTKHLKNLKVSTSSSQKLNLGKSSRFRKGTQSMSQKIKISSKKLSQDTTHVHERYTRLEENLSSQKFPSGENIFRT